MSDLQVDHRFRSIEGETASSRRTALTPDAYEPISLQQDWIFIARELADRLAETASQRDIKGGHAGAERDLIRHTGLLNLSVPRRYGGADGSWTLVFEIVRCLAVADSAVAHLFAFHHLQVATVLLYGNDLQKQQLLQRTVKAGLFWGNALNPRDRRCVATAHADGSYTFDGDKAFCSGSVGADYLSVSAWHEDSDSLVIAAIPVDRTGVTVHGDWDAIGQRQTDSGSVSFERVRIEPNEVLVPAGEPAHPKGQLRSCIAQLVLVNLYIGLGEGALNKARELTLHKAKAWSAAAVDTASDDPFIQLRYGRLWVKLRAAQVLAGNAAKLLDELFFPGVAITEADRGRVAIAVAEAKVAAHDVSLEASSELFELGGTASVRKNDNLDRFWRNARTHTLHDPIDYKLRDLGRWAISGDYPVPTSYS